MADSLSLLERYAAAKQAIIDDIERHQDVFGAHQRLVMSLVDAENALRDAVAESGQGVSNPEYVVTVTPIENEVCDFAKLDELVAAGAISNELRQQFVKKQKRPARIAITAR